MATTDPPVSPHLRELLQQRYPLWTWTQGYQQVLGDSDTDLHVDIDLADHGEAEIAVYLGDTQVAEAVVRPPLARQVPAYVDLLLVTILHDLGDLAADVVCSLASIPDRRAAAIVPDPDDLGGEE